MHACPASRRRSTWSSVTSTGAVTRCDDLAWHEVFALVRALAINDRHQRITDDPRRLDNPMGNILLARLEAASRSEENR